MKHFYFTPLLALLGLTGASRASESFVDSTRFEATVRQLELSIIAPCCWHQPVANHTSPIALEIRQEIREAVRQGKSPEEIKADYVRRYGERILAVPPKNAFNQFLWIIPVAASITAFGVAGQLLRTWRRRGPGAPGKSPAKNGQPTASPGLFAKVDEQLRKWDE